ncbi:Tetratricopeptide repeat protein 12 [Acipenser ruthenus]|uniref:Tetratricopeptide repeat protein 12 n=1 Tax=Acipenser ruthenus TaxID=7906 RepID=A0A444V005_ACIRT|nr:Tetratricopeptide repeat protein 12 [Acipenser ruthenus]
MTTEAADLEKFLKQVDQISELVKEMNSSDAVSQQRAAEKADQLISAFKENGETEELCKTRLNRTVINNKPERNEAAPCGLRNDADTSQALKEMGNEAFAKGDYETAVQRYSEGLEKLRDMQVLYTNRAQAHRCYQKILEIDPKQERLVKGTEQTLFKINNGFSIINSNTIVQRLLERLMGYMHHQDLIAANAVGIMANLAADKK